MPAKEWFREWFNSPYYDLLYERRNEEEAKNFIIYLTSYLRPAKESYMLDAACGKGRYSKALASFGFDVTGVDLSGSNVAEAKKYETDRLHFFLHDIRLPFWINYFDYAFNFFTSFGYFRTQREHDDAIRTITQSLRPHGIFVIDYLNVHYAEEHLVKSEDVTIEDVSFHITRHCDEDHFFKRIEVEDRSRHYRHLFTETIAKFSPGDFTDMLSYQNMEIRDFFGDYELSHYDTRKSPRLIIIAGKRAG